MRTRTAVAAAASAGLVAAGVVAGASSATAADRPARQDGFAACVSTYGQVICGFQSSKMPLGLGFHTQACSSQNAGSP